MTSQTMLRQIDRLKSDLEAIRPKPPATIKILLQPGPKSGEECLLGFLKEVREAKGSHDHVFVACFNSLDERKGQVIDGVHYFESDFAAIGAKAFWDKKGILEFVQSLSGNIVSPKPIWGTPIEDSETED